MIISSFQRVEERGRESYALPTEESEGYEYRKDNVCRPFLCGLCPGYLLQLTRKEWVPCSKVHSLRLRKEYEKAKAKGVDNYDIELEKAMELLIDDRDKTIAGALKCLEEKDAEEAMKISVKEVTETPEVMELSKQIKEKLKEADEFELEGKMDFKIRALEEVEELRTKRADEQAALLLDAFNKDGACLGPVHALGSRMFGAQDVCCTDRKLHICDVCGAFLSVYDSGRRLAYHFMGKLHSGYMEIEDKLVELQHSSFQGEKHKKRRLNEDGVRDREMELCESETASIGQLQRPSRKLFYVYYLDERENYTISAALSSPYADKAYIFMRNEYVVVDYTLGMRINEVKEGPFFMCCGFPPLRGTIFDDYGLQCGFRCKDTNEVFFFCGWYCVKMKLAPDDTKKSEIIEGVDMVQTLFPCLKGTGFERCVDAAFESSVDGEAYLFCGTQYAHIRYSPKRELIGIRGITEGFPCLRNTIFWSGISAAFTSHRPQEVYLFKLDYYALLFFSPDPTCCRLIGGVKEILLNWPCLRGILPRLDGRSLFYHRHPKTDHDLYHDFDYDQEES